MVSSDGVKSSTARAALTGRWDSRGESVPQEAGGARTIKPTSLSGKALFAQVFPETDRSCYLPSPWLGCQYVKSKRTSLFRGSACCLGGS